MFNFYQKETTEPYWVNIWIAGNHAKAIDICRKFCNENSLCVTVTPTDYVYTGGMQSGVVVRLINYPRFPASIPDILYKATLLANILGKELYQKSYTIETPEFNNYYEVKYNEES